MRAGLLRYVLVGAIAFVVVTIVFVKTQSSDLGNHLQLVEHFRELKELEATLNQDILKSRSGFLASYDSFVATVARIKQLDARLRDDLAEVTAERTDVAQRLHAWEDTLVQREALLERFKSENAVLQNSLRYFPLATARLAADPRGRGALAPILHPLLEHILLYHVSGARELVPEIDEMLGSLAVERRRFAGDFGTSLDYLVSHARIIVGQKVEVDARLAELLALPTASRLDALSRAYTAHYEQAVRRRNVYRAYLYLVSLILLSSIAFVMLKLHRSHAQLEESADELRESEARYRRLFEQSRDAIVVVAREGRILDANNAALELFGYARAELAGTSVQALYADGADGDRLQHALERATSVRDFEATLRKNDGTLMECLLTATAWREPDGTVLGYQAICRDITERKRLEEELRQSQKMEAIGRLAGGVAHDFNNLLTIILGRSELLLRRLGANEAWRRDVALIEKTGQRAATLTGQLLAFSRKQVIQPTVLDVNGVVANLEDMLRRLIGEDVRIRLELDPTAGRIKADRVQLEQVLLNLAVNARDAMPGGGTLTIATREVVLDEAFARQHPGSRSGACVAVAVSDTGVGMDAEVQARIFEPFFTTKERGKGTGLGLAMVYGIVKQHEGYIAAASAPGAGSTFTVYLPRGEAVEEVEAPPPARTSTATKATVLVVEDEGDVRELAGEILRTEGYSVLEAATPPDGLAVCARHPEPIDLLVTDVVMPDMNGRDLAERLRRMRPGIKVLYISGYTPDAIARRGVLDPGVALLQKPFTPDSLLRRVREVLHRPPGPL